MIKKIVIKIVPELSFQERNRRAAAPGPPAIFTRRIKDKSLAFPWVFF